MEAPTSTVIRAGDMVFVSGIPPFDPETGVFRKRAEPADVVKALKEMKLGR